MINRRDIVRKAEELIHAIEPDAEIILFGSEARGNARPDSDIDLLVLLSGNQKSVDREMVLFEPLYMLEGQTGISISPKIYLKKDWENRPFVTPFYFSTPQSLDSFTLFLI